MAITAHEPTVLSIRRNQLCFEPRPPFMPPEVRSVSDDRVEPFRHWLIAEFGLAAQARVVVVEWVSFDGREPPHVTIVMLESGARQLSFFVAKRLDAIERADLPSWLSKNRADALASPAERATFSSQRETPTGSGFR
jgi:hypothetical protein